MPPVLTESPLTGPYQVPAARVQVLGVATNKVPTGPYRGANRPERAYFCDRMAEQAAAELGIDRAEIRRNLIPPAALPYRTPARTTIDSGDFPRLLEHLTRMLSYEAELADRDHARERGEVRGGGMSVFLESAGLGWPAIVGGSALVSAAADSRHQVIARAAAARGVAEDQVLAELAAGPSPAPRSSDPRPADRSEGG